MIAPSSAYPRGTAGRLFPNVHVGGTNGREDAGMGVQASLSADSVWSLRFPFPVTLPAGTCKLVLRALANATSGAAKVNPKWASCAAEESPDTITLNAEGTTTVTWGAGDNDQYKEVKIILDADTPVAGETLVMDLTFETASWTLAQISTWQAFVIWE